MHNLEQDILKPKLDNIDVDEWTAEDNDRWMFFKRQIQPIIFQYLKTEFFANDSDQFSAWLAADSQEPLLMKISDTAKEILQKNKDISDAVWAQEVFQVLIAESDIKKTLEQIKPVTGLDESAYNTAKEIYQDEKRKIMH